MDWENFILGSVCIVWGCIAIAFRKELYKLAKESGRGLKDIRILRPLIIFLCFALPIAGLYLILMRGIL